MTEVRSQRTEVRGQKSEDRSQRSEISGQLTEDRIRIEDLSIPGLLLINSVEDLTWVNPKT
jgi:hypothetical protein